MANIGQVVYNVPNKTAGTGTYKYPSSIDIYSDIVAQVGARQFSKVGVQSPPGTRLVLNTNKQILIGRTGIYELDEDIAITNLYFVQPTKYSRNEEESLAAVNEGLTIIKRAESVRVEKMRALNFNYPTPPGPEDTAYWNSYNTIESEYLNGDGSSEPEYDGEGNMTNNPGYNIGLNRYNLGTNGIYDLDGYEDLENVIVDFIYT